LQSAGREEVAELRRHRVTAADLVPQRRFLDHEDERVPWLVDDQGPVDSGPGSLGAVVNGQVPERGADAQDASGAALSLQGRYERRRVHPEVAGVLEQSGLAPLQCAESVAHFGAPLGIHGLGVDRLRDQVVAWSSASQARHHRRMSVALGAVCAFSMRYVLAWCQPHRSASSVTVSPALLRMSRSRWATTLHAA
jgi:hypothetical protein